eukprot:scaffold7017_cov134-Cylindrotheca_fusiformis.AAC.29
MSTNKKTRCFIFDSAKQVAVWLAINTQSKAVFVHVPCVRVVSSFSVESPAKAAQFDVFEVSREQKEWLAFLIGDRTLRRKNYAIRDSRKNRSDNEIALIGRENIK